MSKLVEIKISNGCLLVLTDSELMAGLPEELLARGLKRGKGLRRRRAAAERYDRDCYKRTQKRAIEHEADMLSEMVKK